MKAEAVALRRGIDARSLALVAASVSVFLLIGLVIARGFGQIAAALVVAAVALALGARSWRASMYGLLFYLPVSGIPIIVLYPDTSPALLAKDVLFVLPAYVGFAAYALRNGPRPGPRPRGKILLVLLALTVVGQTANAALTNPLVGLIGAKVWLGYLPLYFLGFWLVRGRADLRRLLAAMSLAALVPVVVGLLEAMLIYSGNPGVVYRFYGDAAASVTQDFAQFEYAGGGSLRRISSTFSFVTQYYVFTSAMVAVVYAWWRFSLHGTRWSFSGYLAWAGVICAGFLTGARGAFVFIPLLVGLILVLEHGSRVLTPLRLLAPAAMFVAAVTVIGAGTAEIFFGTINLGLEEVRDSLVGGMGKAFDLTWAGLGAGVDTNAARYASGDAAQFPAVGGTWYESWWVKVQLELGVTGLALVLAATVAFLIGGIRAHRRLRDPRLKSVSASLFAFVLWTLIYGTKGQYLDLDPANVYFWLFAGVLMRIWTLEQTEAVDDNG